MRFAIFSLLTTTSLVSGLSLAQAADLYDAPVMEPAPMMDVAPVSSGWTGLYLGVQGGGAFNPKCARLECAARDACPWA